MPCEIKQIGETTAIVCSRGGSKRCCYCGRPSTQLCDFPLTGAKAGTTCDLPMCRRCSHRVSPDKDYCRPHAAMIAEARPVLRSSSATEGG